MNSLGITSARLVATAACFVTIIVLLSSVSLASDPAGRRYLTISAFAGTYASSLNAYRIIQHPLPNGSSEPWGITTDKSGNVWFVEQSSNQLGKYDPVTGTFSEYGIPTAHSSPEELAVDGSGNVWITQLQPSDLGMLARGSQTIREFGIPKGPDNLECGPIDVVPDKQGHVWVTCEFSNQIDEFFPTGGSFHEYDMPVFFSAPLSIVFDSSGNFWFTTADSDMLGYVDVASLLNGTADGIDEFAPVNQTSAQTYSIPTDFLGQGSTEIVSSLSTPADLALSPDGKSLWITEHTASSFDRFDTGSHSLTKYWTSQTYSTSYSKSLPNGVVVDGSGHVWIAEHYGNRIAEFNASTEEMTEYPIACCGIGIAGSLYLVVGQNSTVWFSEFNGNAIGELRPVATGDRLDISVRNGSTGTLGPESSAIVSISLSTNGPPLGAKMIISGISMTGALQGMSATFSPSTLSLGSNETASTRLFLTTDGLAPGVYYLTVGADVSPGGTIYSFVLKLTVFAGLDAWHDLAVYGAVGSVVASVAVVAGLAYWRRRKARYKMSLIRKRRERLRRGRSRVCLQLYYALLNVKHRNGESS